MDGDEELRTALISGFDNFAEICLACVGFVHCGVVDGVSELLQFGDQGFDNGSGDFTLSEALINGSVARARCRVPGVDAYLYGQHLLSACIVSRSRVSLRIMLKGHPCGCPFCGYRFLIFASALACTRCVCAHS